jgi:hypothetical protein
VKCRSADITGNLISVDATPDDESAGLGIQVLNDEHWCVDVLPYLAGSDSIRVLDNTLSWEVDPNGAWAGIQLTWACGPGSKGVRVAGNVVSDWTGYGISMSECSDTLVQCNDLLANRMVTAQSGVVAPIDTTRALVVFVAIPDIACWLMALVLGVASGARSEQLVLSVSDWASIENGSGQARLLFHVSDLPEGNRIAVMHAELRLPLTGSAAARRYDLRLYPLTRSWISGDVDWYEGWDRPGGDVRDDLLSHCAADLARGPQSVVFDVRSAVVEMMNGDLAENGFLLTVASRQGEGIDSEDLDRFDGLGDGTLTIRYRKVSRKPALGS